MEVLLELAPFGVGGFSILLGWAHRPSTVQEAAVGADQVVLEDGVVGLGGVDAGVAE